MKKLILIIILLSFSNIIYSQNDDSTLRKSRLMFTAKYDFVDMKYILKEEIYVTSITYAIVHDRNSALPTFSLRYMDDEIVMNTYYRIDSMSTTNNITQYNLSDMFNNQILLIQREDGFELYFNPFYYIKDNNIVYKNYWIGKRIE